MLRQMTVWTCAALLLIGTAWAADTKKELEELDTLEGYKQLKEEGTVKKDLETMPKQALETIIVWSDANPSSGPAPLAVEFVADPPPGVTGPTYAWDFGDGSAAGSGPSVKHTFAKPGVYKVMLKVSNAAGLLGEDELRVKVTP